MENAEDIKKEREIVWVQILYLYIIPTLLIYFNIIPKDLRALVLFIVAIFLFGIVRHAKWTYKDIGIKKNFMKDIVPYSLLTMGGVFFLVWLASVVPHEPFINWWKNLRFLLLFIPVSVLQEIVFRGILINMEERVFRSPIFIIALNAGIFAFMHVIYLNSIFVLPMTFIAGVAFAWIYYKYKNLILISASHVVLNFVAMILGFFVIR